MKHTERFNNIAYLYLSMPGAPRPPTDDQGREMWGEIENNEHWNFCMSIVVLIDHATRKGGAK